MEKILFSHQEVQKVPKFSGKFQPFSYKTPEWDVQGVRVEPKRLTHEIPLMYVAGWGATIAIHKRPIASLAQRGYDVIAINSPRAENGRREVAGFSLPAIEVVKAEALVQTMQMQGIHKGKSINMITHSEGGIYGAIGALLALKRGIQVKNLVLVSPGGLIGKDTATQLIPRFLHNAFTEENQTGEKDSPANRRLRRVEAIKAIAKPGLTLQEAAAIANTPLGNILTALRAQGVTIAVIQGNLDPVFPIEKMEEQAEKAGVNLFYETRGGHNSLIIRPDLYALQIDDALQRLSEIQ